MRKSILFFALTGLLASCTNASNEERAVAPVKEETPASASTPALDLPYKATYSSDWSIGDPKYTKIALDFYTALAADSIGGMSEYAEDSIQFHAFDDRTLRVHRDEMIERTKAFRRKFKSLDEEFIAFVCLHSNDKDEDWVSLWISEKGVLANGKAESTKYQENWRFRNGKVYYVSNFARYKPGK